ncbi:hypothetical protein Cni_G12342 [Canna indica]|uniref:Uncharacterized protein n=1 Tax=Canna indica TaxID=4628 RepID=A0AAQ3K7M5_9LILI|nr:hypothetical protein Cni_G12342 [Canna indica]
MGCWSPSDAMKAYMNTLQLCKDHYCFEETSQLIEPQCMEYISALAAGNQARLMVDVESGGAVSPFILALAAAARQSGGRLVCARHEEADAAELRRQIETSGLADVVECEAAKTPLETIEQLKCVDFAVIDHALEDCRELAAAVDANPCGSVVVVSNLFKGRRDGGGGASSSYGQVLKREGGVVRSAVLPFGGGMEVTKIGRRVNGKCCGSHAGAGRRFRRTFVVYYEDNATNMGCTLIGHVVVPEWLSGMTRNGFARAGSNAVDHELCCVLPDLIRLFFIEQSIFVINEYRGQLSHFSKYRSIEAMDTGHPRKFSSKSCGPLDFGEISRCLSLAFALSFFTHVAGGFSESLTLSSSWYSRGALSLVLVQGLGEQNFPGLGNPL